MFHSDAKKENEKEVRKLKNELRKELKEQILTEIKEEIEKWIRKNYEEIRKEEIELEKKIIRPEVSALLSLIELLEEKEVISEQELDDKFKQLDPLDYERLKLIYGLFHAKKEELKNLSDADKESDKENE